MHKCGEVPSFVYLYCAVSTKWACQGCVLVQVVHWRDVTVLHALRCTAWSNVTTSCDHRWYSTISSMVQSIVYAVAVLAPPKKKYYKSAIMNPKQVLVCCELVFSSLVSLHFPAESAPTRERLESSDTNPSVWQWRDKLRALLDSNSTNSDYVAAEGYWMLRGLSSLTCDACEFAVRILLDLFHVGKEWDYLATAAGDLCYVLKIEDRNVCMPITQLFKVLVITDVLNYLHHIYCASYTMRLLCTSVCWQPDI